MRQNPSEMSRAERVAAFHETAVHKTRPAAQAAALEASETEGFDLDDIVIWISDKTIKFGWYFGDDDPNQTGAEEPRRSVAITPESSGLLDTHDDPDPLADGLASYTEADGAGLVAADEVVDDTTPEDTVLEEPEPASGALVVAPEPVAASTPAPTPAPAPEPAPRPSAAVLGACAVIGDPDTEEAIRKLAKELAIKFPGVRFTLAKADTGQRVEHLECKIISTPILEAA